MTIMDSPILAQERRRKAAEHARHEARLEGLSPNPQTEPLFVQYVEGTLTGDELRARLKAHYTKP